MCQGQNRGLWHFSTLGVLLFVRHYPPQPVTVGPRASLQCSYLLIERAEKSGQNRGRTHQILTPNESTLTFGPVTSVQNFIKIEWKLQLAEQ